MKSELVELPPLKTGERLTRDEFIARWEATPNLKYAELIGGIVLLRMPLSDDHGGAHAPVAGCLFVYQASTPGCKSSIGSSWYMRDDMPQPENSLRILPEYGGQSTILKRKGKHYLVGAPELVVEVSLSTRTHDMKAKKELYRKAGVWEYINIQPERNKVIFLRLKNGEYHEIESTDGIFRSEMFPGLWLDSKALLNEDSARILAVLQEGLKSSEHAAFVAKLADRKSKP